MRKRVLIAASGLLAFVIAIWGVQARAQDQGPGPGQMGRMGGMHRMTPDEELKQLDKTLKLTDDQKNQIKPILEDRQQKMQSLHSDSSLSMDDRRTKMRSIMEESNGKIRDVLNDDQKKKFDDMQQHRHGPRGGGPEGGGPGGPPPTNPQ